MNRDYQLEQLRSLLMAPELKSGLFLIDTDLTDDEIEKYLKSFGIFSYVREALFPSSEGSVFEMFVVGLSFKCKCPDILTRRQQMFAAEGRRRGGVLYSMVIEMMGVR